ncbi:MAG TPA: hypothetical protein PL009_08850 [Flavipsychrobacter sp.]|nr:hypothetical protein [Flavipsychrobacter sp.]
MKGYIFSHHQPNNDKPPFQRLLDMFIELLQYTNGDAAEALQWLTQLDQQYNLTTTDYGIGNFIQDLKTQGYIHPHTPQQKPRITPKTEQTIRQQALQEIFGKLKKTKPGNHHTPKNGHGDETNPETRPYQFGDPLHTIDFTHSLKNSLINHGIDHLSIHQSDLETQQTDLKTQTSTILMIDISHSMILYGEDRITPAKKVAMALYQLITTQYPKDTLDIIVFGNDAWQILPKDLPYLQVGPFHTNTVAGLQLATSILRRRKNPNKQIFMITDGKPTCLKIGNQYYKNSFGTDRIILNRTLAHAAHLRRHHTPVTTFMIANDPHLRHFVRTFTQVNHGKAFYTTPDNLGHHIFEDYQRNKRKHTR